MKSHLNGTSRHAAHRFFRSPSRKLLLTLVLVASIPSPASAFLAPAFKSTNLAHGRIATASSASSNEDVFDSLSLVERARAVLEKSKAKLAEQEERSAPTAAATKKTVTPETNTPFFAQRSVNRDQVVKSKDDKTGLITANGEVMAAISEQEDWEMRSLSEVFENETDENGDVYSLASQQLAERDVAASVWNLRQKLHTNDYLKIFDKRNRFIGELD